VLSHSCADNAHEWGTGGISLFLKGHSEVVESGSALREVVVAILAGDAAGVSGLLAASPQLARTAFESGATRQTENAFFVDQIKRYIYAGDTALHIAAAAYQTEIVRKLLAAGADVHARNRRGQESLHAAASGSPGAHWWNPTAQAATITVLVEAGADPNVFDKSGVSPLHKAVRTRCATAVRTLLDLGADPARPNKNGSTPLVLATHNTGRGGTGTPDAKSQQQEILRLLDERLQAR
jgi:Ankyrin repeats (many copies)